MIGRTIGNYVVRAKVGEGGMGVVYRAEHPQINRRVAIKVLHPGVDRNAELVHRFFNEAKAASEIRNEHIVDVLDFGELPDGAPYLVMEWLEGQSLGDVLRAQPRQSATRTAAVVRGIAEALQAAHARGVIHRDLKPDNVFLVLRNGDPDFIKVLDFGIAKLIQDNDANRYQTQTGAIIGTPAYMSPEQCRGAKSIDTRTDVYSLGVIAYQMLTGRLPFAAQALGELLFKHLTEEPPPATSLQPDVPASMSAVVAQALAKAPEARPTLDQLIAAMDAVAAGVAGPLSTPVRPPLEAAKTAAPDATSAPAGQIGSATTLGATASELAFGDGSLDQPRRRARKPLSGKVVALVVVGFSVTAAVASVMVRRASAPTRNAELQRVIAERAAQVAAAHPTVRVEIRTEPAAAGLELDGRKVANPFIRSGASDGVGHEMVATYPGFDPARQSITFDRDRHLLLKLSASQNSSDVVVVGQGGPTHPPGAPTPNTREPPRPRKGGPQSGSPGTGAPGYHGSKLKIETDFP